MEILRQIGNLVLGALPSLFLILVLYFFLRTHFFRPLEKMFEERSARIDGARRSAEAAQAAAEAKTRAYQEALRKARAEIYAEQDAARRAVLDERAALIRETRERSNQTIRSAKSRIQAEVAAARAELEKQSEVLAGEIVRLVLEGRGMPPAGKEAR